MEGKEFNWVKIVTVAGSIVALIVTLATGISNFVDFVDRTYVDQEEFDEYRRKLGTAIYQLEIETVKRELDWELSHKIPKDEEHIKFLKDEVITLKRQRDRYMATGVAEIGDHINLSTPMNE